MNKLPVFKKTQDENLINAEWLEVCVINILNSDIL
mgnify:CR=1 FL=1